MVGRERDLVWQTGTRDAMRSFPEGVRWVFGRALYKVELGKRPRNASTLKGNLGGILELATDEQNSTYRLYYTLKCPGRVYVLYCHQKKSKRGIGIPRHEEDLIARRFRDALIDCRERREGSR